MEVLFLTMRRNGRTFKTRLLTPPSATDREFLESLVLVLDLESMEVHYVEGNGIKSLVINR